MNKEVIMSGEGGRERKRDGLGHASWFFLRGSGFMTVA
jgi:hypothetical protein